MITARNVFAELEGLDKVLFRVELMDDPWYSERTVNRLIASANPRDAEAVQRFRDTPKVVVVRVRLKNGMLELHPDGDSIKVKCYCCFEGDPDKGTATLDTVRERVESLKDHYCPPWPG
jgi:hypothetical protein